MSSLPEALCAWVLVVDDNADLRAVLETVLRLAGYRVRSASDGREALDILMAESSPQLVLLDLWMPKMDGWSLLRELRLRGCVQHKVVVLTADAYAQLPDETDVMLKPVPTEVILEVVARHVARATGRMTKTAALTSSVHEAAGVRGQATILVVDDDPDLRDVFSELLNAAGYRVYGAAHGEEALALLDSGVAPDLILLDLMMPVMDGWAFMHELQQSGRLERQPIVVISAAGAIHVPATVNCLGKPVSGARLLATVAQACRHALPSA